MKRKAIRRKPKPKRDPEQQELWDAAWAEWHAPVQARGAYCAVCGSTARFQLQGHHVISQQELGRYAASRGLTEAELRELLTDPRNRLICCTYPCHTLHTSAMKRIPRRVLPVVAYQFADEIGRRWYLERYYPIGPLDGRPRIHTRR